MQVPTFYKRFHRHPERYLAAVCITLLLLKYLLPLFFFDIPLGFDAGIYRFLFLKYKEALMHLHLPVLDPWAQEHPIGLFLFSTPLLLLGVSLDLLLGWMWNLFPVALLILLSYITWKRVGAATGVAILLVGFLSQPFYDGFVAMYWKAYVSLFFIVLAYDAFDRKSWMFYFFAFIAVITHHQTGLIIALAVSTWWILNIRKGWNDPFWRNMTVLCALLAAATLAMYARQWERAFWSPLKSIILLRGDDAPGGAFPDTLFYVRTMSVTLALGIFGFIRSLRHRFNLWQLSVLWCAVFIVFRLVFYRRFFLQLDFFLLPFAAAGLVFLWKRFDSITVRVLILGILLAQMIVSLQAVALRTPVYSSVRLKEIAALAVLLPRGASVIALENQSGPWLLGWLPDQHVGAPGLFDYPGWTYDQWEGFLYGTNKQRKALLQGLRGDVYFFLTPAFVQYYGEHVRGFLEDPCLSRVEGKPLVQVLCVGSGSLQISP